jgi:molecular chaperone GrpE (heat shock protein)
LAEKEIPKARSQLAELKTRLDIVEQEFEVLDSEVRKKTQDFRK